MVVKEKQVLKAVHRLLTQGRQLFGEGMSSKNSFTYFDELEGLMGYSIAWQDDKSDRFESELKKVCLAANAPSFFEEFKR
jgi:hypothetical protein